MKCLPSVRMCACAVECMLGFRAFPHFNAMFSVCLCVCVPTPVGVCVYSLNVCVFVFTEVCVCVFTEVCLLTLTHTLTLTLRCRVSSPHRSFVWTVHSMADCDSLDNVPPLLPLGNSAASTPSSSGFSAVNIAVGVGAAAIGACLRSFLRIPRHLDSPSLRSFVCVCVV